jgi:hypothetical protein
MDDNLKDLIKNLPEIEPPKPVEEIVAETIKRQLIWLWEKRLAIVSGFLVLTLGYLTLVETGRLARRLGTAGFWAFLSQDKEWFFDEPLVVLAAFLEANPWQEVIYLLFLLAVLGYSLYTLLSKMARRKNLLTIGIFFVLIVVAIVTRITLKSSVPQTRTVLPENPFTYSQEVSPTEEATEAEDSVLISSTDTNKEEDKKSFFLEVTSPQDGVTVKTSQIEVRGRVSLGSEIFVNEKQVSHDQNGNFSVKIDLVEGVNPILVVAGNEVGDREIERVVYYELE